MEYLIVGAGGILGSITRYALGKWISNRLKGDIPWGTFFINITGAFFLGIVSSIYSGGNLYLLLAEGYLGAYTTFSTFMYEGFNMFQNKKRINAIIYIFSSIFIGFIGFMSGVWLAGLYI